jgi:mono/diheme cytochrome c family protein
MSGTSAGSLSAVMTSSQTNFQMNFQMNSWNLAHRLILVTFLTGCGTAGPSSAAKPAAPADATSRPTDATPVVVIYRNRCGSCHRPVAPGSEPSDKLHAALLLHRKRCHLSEQQWAGIEAFLAPPAAH